MIPRWEKSVPVGKVIKLVDTNLLGVGTHRQGPNAQGKIGTCASTCASVS